MSINNIQFEIQNAEQYKIRKQTEETKQAEIQQAEQAAQAVQEIKQVDEYDKANPVGEQVEGIYSVSHDDNGNLKIDYKEPSSEKNEKNETMQVKADEKSANSAKSGGAAPTSGTEKSSETDDDDDDNEEELEKLKRQRDAIRQQLNSAADEDTKAALRAQLQAIELQIAMKSSETN